MRYIPRRDDRCTARFHGTGARRDHGCACPPSATEYARRDRRAEMVRKGPKMIHILRSEDVDDIAIDRALMGQAPTVLTQGEVLVVIGTLTEKGHSAREIGSRLKLSTRSVVRYRRRLSVT